MTLLKLGAKLSLPWGETGLGTLVWNTCPRALQCPQCHLQRVDKANTAHNTATSSRAWQAHVSPLYSQWIWYYKSHFIPIWKKELQLNRNWFSNELCVCVCSWLVDCLKPFQPNNVQREQFSITCSWQQDWFYVSECQSSPFSFGKKTASWNNHERRKYCST